MQKLEINHTPEYTELVFRNEKTGEVTALYGRKNCTVVVKERGEELLECHSFGTGPLQKFRELAEKEHPPTENEIYGKLKEREE